MGSPYAFYLFFSNDLHVLDRLFDRLGFYLPRDYHLFEVDNLVGFSRLCSGYYREEQHRNDSDIM